jgi:hypothetical protein
VLTAVVTSGFVARAQTGRDDPVERKLDAVGEELKAVRAELAELKVVRAELEQLLSRIDTDRSD